MKEAIQFSAICVLFASFTASGEVDSCQGNVHRDRSDVAQQAQAGKEMIGRWVNEVNSVLVIEQVDDNGIIQGKYNSAKGEAEGYYTLIGASEPGKLDRSEGRPVGFTVVWKNDHKNAHSVTTWSGLFFSFPDEDVIVANWLLASATDYKDVWGATRVGQDRFVKTTEKPQ